MRTHKKRDHCRRGHLYTPENTSYFTGRNGRTYRKCMECNRILWQAKKDQYTRNRRGNPDEIRKQKQREARRFAEDPRKAYARRKVNFHVRKGWLKKPDACERCGAIAKLDGSHDDYDKPLEVEWLCRPCHGAKDRKYNPIDPPAYKLASGDGVILPSNPRQGDGS